MSQSIKNEYAVFLKARDKNLPAVITNKEEGNLLIKYLNLTPDPSQEEGLDIYTDSADNQGKVVFSFHELCKTEMENSMSGMTI